MPWEEGVVGPVTNVGPTRSPSRHPWGELPGLPGLLLLASFVFLALFLGWEPLLSFASWGSDSGEYALLTGSLVSHGRLLLVGFSGWGFGYPYFPGMFEVGAGVAGATGTDPLLALELAVPALAALSVVPAYLLFRRIYPSEPVALLGAGLAAVAFPRVFVLSHAAPAALGDLLAVASLWFLLEQRRDPRWWALLLPAATGLVLTHHLSSYFFLLSAWGIVVGLELYAPYRWSRRFPWRELVFLGGFTLLLFVYWFDYAPPFATIVGEGVPGAPLWTAPAVSLGAVAASGLVVHLRRHGVLLGHGPLWKTRWPSRTRLLRDAGLLALFLVAGLGYLLLFPLPGTSDVVPASDLLFFAPFLVLVPVVAGGRSFGTLTRTGAVPVAWFGAIALSASFALHTANEAIPPARHAEFLALPLLLMVSIALGQGLSALARSPDRRPFAFALVGVGVLLAANAATVYPPPALLEGFQEGLTPSETGLVSFAVVALPGPATLASDHRLSDLYFGESGGRAATWGSALCLFEGKNSSCAVSEVRGLAFPLSTDAPRPLDAVAVDATMREQGVALDPNAPAVPMSDCAQERLAGEGFVVLYVSGENTLLWVDLPALSVSAGAGACGPTGH